MRIPCPTCGTRDRREFTYQGDSIAMDRPASDAPLEAWDEYLHLRTNPAGDTVDLWYHDPCGTWCVVRRDTVTHAVYGALKASEIGT